MTGDTGATRDPIADAVEQLLQGICPPRRVREIERGGSGADVWRAILASGFADALLPEEHGGAGLGLTGAFPILLACGRHALPLPLATTMIVRAVLASADRRIPDGPATFASCAGTSVRDRIACLRVPYGRVADWILVDLGGSGALLPASEAEVAPSGGHGSLDADVTWSNPAADRFPLAYDWRSAGGTIMAAQLAGAMERVLASTVDHANVRTQFGRSIGKFQAIQQQLSVMAEQVSASRMAARMGCHGDGHAPNALWAAVAKARTSEAAAGVAAIAHAVHGAIGIAAEYDLQLYTRRLHEWRFAFGSESYWNERIGGVLVDSDGTSAFDFVRERLFPFDR